MKQVQAFIFFLLFIFPLTVPAAVIHVPGDQPTIQAGIDAAVNGDTVLVADGTYTGTGNRDIDFGGKAITVRSENGAENCIVDCQGTESEPHRGFYFHSGEGSDAVVEGFMIQNGCSSEGGAVYILASSPTLTHNRITGNIASDGSGIFCENAAPLITHNTISENSTSTTWSEGGGGGISLIQSSATIKNNTIASNTYDPWSGYNTGAGIRCIESSALIAENLIDGNDYAEYGGGIYFSDCPSASVTNNVISNNHGIMRGGGIYGTNSSVKISGNTITGNKSHDGGGIYGSYLTITNNTILDNEVNDEGGGLYIRFNSEIRDNIISGNFSSWDGGGIYIYIGSNCEVRGNVISGNICESEGGGIYCNNSGETDTVIANNLIKENEAHWGAGIFTDGRGSNNSPAILNNTIRDNRARRGGGIYCYRGDPTLRDNLILSNTAGYRGGGINCYHDASPVITNNLIFDNLTLEGGGIFCELESSPVITNCTISANTANDSGGGIYSSDASNPVITNSILWNNSPQEVYAESADPPVITYSNVQGGYVGTGNINANPVFKSTPQGDYYLSQVAAGQAVDSPCVNAGDPAANMIAGTTRTDGVLDAGVVDMGYHYPTIGLVAGSGHTYANPPYVRVLTLTQNGSHLFEFSAYGAPHWGVNVTCGDVKGDALDEILTGPGPGNIFGPHVRGFEVNGTPVQGLSFLAYGTRKWGVNVAAGELDKDGFDEIITGPGPGAIFGPHVRAFDYDGSPPVIPVPGVSYFAYGTRKWGVNVARGDMDGDGFDEIITGAGPGPVFGPHVRGWNVDGGTASAMPSVSYFAYSTRKWGVGVASGNVDGDGFDEIVTAPGPCWYFGTHVRGWNYDNASISSLPGFSYFAWPSSDARYGANVFSGADLNNDGHDELAVGCGPDPAVGSPVKMFLYDGSQVMEWFSLQAFPSGYTHGANVAAGWF